MGQFIMILLISILVLVHEAGHFIAARMCGIRVTRFGIGMPFGPSWKMFRLGKTDFYIHAFLFGGYVSFPEDEPENQGASASDANKVTSGIVDENNEEIPENELYENKTILQKLFVVSAGVLMNIIFAILLVMFCAAHYHQLPASTYKLYFEGFDKNIASNISDYDFKKGDRIIKINQDLVESFHQFRFYIDKSKLYDDYVQTDLIEKNLVLLKKINPNLNDVIPAGTLVIIPDRLPEKALTVKKDVLKGLERYKNDGVKLTNAQLEIRNAIKDKKIFKTTDETILMDIACAISDSYKPLSITVMRDNKEIIFDNIIVGENGLLGVKITTEENFIKINSKKDVVLKSYDYVYKTTSLMLKGLGNLLLGKVNMSDMHGVIAVVKIGSDVISAKGLLNGLLLTAMISINLAIMNFLPIPALDGGHVMFLLIEKITGKKPSKEFGEKITNFFFALLITLMILICFNDIFALITNKF